jgi:hypothetical protein
MKIFNNEITGDLIIESDSQYNALAVNSVTVTEYVTARLYGNIKKDLVVKKGAKVYLHGDVGGKIKNSDGIAYIFDKNGNVRTFTGSDQK